MPRPAAGAARLAHPAPPHTGTTATANAPPGKKESTTELKALVELGAGVHCRARVPDAALVCVSVGLGFHLECTLPEAAIIASNRQRALQVRPRRRGAGSRAWLMRRRAVVAVAVAGAQPG